MKDIKAKDARGPSSESIAVKGGNITLLRSINNGIYTYAALSV